MDLHIVIAPEQIGTLWGLPITNTLLTSWLVMAGLIVFAVIVKNGISLVPQGAQNAIEMIFEYVFDFIDEVIHDKKLAAFMFPLLVTIFLYVWASNWIEFLPGVGSIGVQGECGRGVCEPLFRSVSTDLNVTIALALVSIAVTEAAGIAKFGWGYGKKFFNFSHPLNFFIGLIELVSEIARVVSFSFRLFGNIFAGEVLIAVAVAFIPFVLPIPIMLFELFVGFIQAAIFALLTLFFVKIAITGAEH